MLARILLIITMLLPGYALSQPELRPVDEAASVPDFFSFRAHIQSAVARRDVSAVLAALHKDVKLSFGGDSGVEDFKKVWRPAAPNSPLWETLGTVLALGGTFAPDRTFTAPYVFTQWPSDVDAFTHMAAVGSGIRVRSAPNSSAPVIASLTFTIVELEETQPQGERWARVKLRDGRTGFVDSRFVRSPVDYRINFAKVDGRWQITFFLAGD